MRNGSVGRRLLFGRQFWILCAIFVGSFRQEIRGGIGMVRTVDKLLLLVVEITYIIPSLSINFFRAQP